jgi:hypothetical protein
MTRRGNQWKAGPKTLINGELKIQKHGKRASCIGDGSNIVLAFEVLISLGARDHGTLKTPKPHFSGTPFWVTLEPFWPLLGIFGACL